ncbi:MAG TPA: SRPBCC family protein [Propionibacteriaceae bacterium]|nr:SRPBCC family protein [Propionibacteriaceae bacterium]
MKRSVAVVGPASPEEAWERYAVITRWPEWAPPIRAVEATAPRLAVGVTGLVLGPGRMPIRFLVDRVDEDARSWTWRVRSGPFRMTLTHDLATTQSGTAATLTVDAATPLALLYPQLAKVALRRLVRAETGRR